MGDTLKILFLSHYFPPEVNAPATRAFEHCKEWVASGHDVTVVTCAPNHPFGVVYDGYKNDYVKEEVEGIKVIRLKTYVTANKGFLKRTLAYISYMIAVILASKSFGKHDVVISTSPQFFNGLAGYFVSRLKDIPWLFEVRDLWPDSILAVGAIKNKLIIRSLYKLELFCYRRANKIVVVTDSFKKYVLEKGIPESKIAVIKNGVDLKLFDSQKIESSHELERDFQSMRGKFIVSYVGTHGMAHALSSVLRAAKKLKAEKHIHFLLVGDGAEKSNLLKMKDEFDLGNVTMLDQKPKSLMPYIWHKTDLSLVHLKKDDLFKTVIPSKIFESLAMGKPILLGVEGESAEMINQSGAGITTEPENHDELAKNILTLSNNPDLMELMAKKGRLYVEGHFDRQNLAKIYEAHLLSLVSDNENMACTRYLKKVGGLGEFVRDDI